MIGPHPCDLNHDGVEDLVLQTRFLSEYGGELSIFFGPLQGDTLNTWEPDIHLVSEPPAEDPYSRFGVQLVCDDLDGDGDHDLLVASPLWNDKLDPISTEGHYFGGALFYFEGPLSSSTTFKDGVHVEQGGFNENLGMNLRPLGDLDGDGIGEYYMVQDDCTPEGVDGIHSGIPPLSEALRIPFLPEDPNNPTCFPTAVADYDGDGLQDFFIRASDYPDHSHLLILGKNLVH